MEVEDRSNEQKLIEVRNVQGPRALDVTATVPGSNPHEEVSLIGQQQWGKPFMSGAPPG